MGWLLFIWNSNLTGCLVLSFAKSGNPTVDWAPLFFSIRNNWRGKCSHHWNCWWKHFPSLRYWMNIIRMNPDKRNVISLLTIFTETKLPEEFNYHYLCNAKLKKIRNKSRAICCVCNIKLMLHRASDWCSREHRRIVMYLFS